jgi:hypothetical protein
MYSKMKRTQVSNVRSRSSDHSPQPHTFSHIFRNATITTYNHVTFSAPQLQPHIIAEAGYTHYMVVCEDVAILLKAVPTDQ